MSFAELLTKRLESIDDIGCNRVPDPTRYIGDAFNATEQSRLRYESRAITLEEHEDYVAAIVREFNPGRKDARPPSSLFDQLETT